MKSRLLLGVAFLLSMAADPAARAANPPSPVRGEKVVLENDKVRVIEYVLEAGVPMGMHSHPRDRVEITITGGHVRVTTEDGKVQEADEKEGAVVFSKASATRHDVVNLGKTALHAYHVELK